MTTTINQSTMSSDSDSPLSLCEVAMKDADVSDDALVRLFRACDAAAVVRLAVRSNNERAVRLLIAENFDLRHMLYEDWFTPLHDAYECASLRIVDLLLDAGLDPRAQTFAGTTPFLFAGCNPDESVMAHLIATGVDVDAATPIGVSLAHCACLNKNANVLAMLIAAGANVAVRTAVGETLCHFAAASSNAAVWPLLVPLCDVNVADNYGFTPCWTAVDYENAPALEALIAAGANVHAVADNGLTAPQRALMIGGEKLIELLIDGGMHPDTVDPKDASTALHLAAERSNHRLLAKLIAAGGNVNARDVYSRTPLHMFCFVDEAKADDAARCAALLIAANADLSVRDVHSYTSLHHASMRGFCECVSLLLDAGADAQARDSGGATPLFFAPTAAVAALFIAAKVDVNTIDNDRQSACHYRLGTPDAVACLIAAGANPHLRDIHGQTALHNAARVEEAFETMSLLIDAKVDVNEGDNNGDCAGHLAARFGQVKNLKFLLEHGARINLYNNAGETMLFIGAAMGHVGVVELLIDAGAALNVRSDGRLSPLEMGLFFSVESARLLLRAGASPHDVGPVGCSTCHSAARSPTHAVQSLQLMIDAGADVHAVDDFGASVAHGATASAFRLLRSLGIDLNGADDRGDTPCHAACNGAALDALFGLGATMTAKNKAGATPFETILALQGEDANEEDDDLLLSLVAAGVGFGVQTQLERADIAAIVIAGGGLVSAQANAAALLAQEGAAIERIFKRQQQLFRLRALEVCMGLQSLRVSALELCEILANMFAPLESIVPFHLAWRVATTVKHFHRV